MIINDDGDDDYNHPIIKRYHKNINPLIIKYNNILISIIDDSDENDTDVQQKQENQQLNQEIIEVIEKRISVIKEKETILLNDKVKLESSINETIKLLELSPDLFQQDQQLNNEYIKLFKETLLKTPKIIKQINLLNEFNINLKNVYNNNKIKLNQVYSTLIKLYNELGIDFINNSDDLEVVSESFKSIGETVSNKRINEIENEIKRLQDINSSIIDKINDSKKVLINLKNELEENSKEFEINNLLKECEKSGCNSNDNIKTSIKLLYKFDNLIKELENIKETKSKQITQLINSIDKDYTQLGIPTNDKDRLEFYKERTKYGSVSTSLLNCLTKESNSLLNLKKLKFKDTFQLKLTKLHSLWDQLCIPLNERSLNQLLGKDSSEGSGSDEDESQYYSIEIFEIIDKQIELLVGLLASMKSILIKVKRREWIKSEMKKFENSASDSTRFKGSSIRLLEEAKFRKTIAREYPILTTDLVKELAEWEHQNNKSFLYFGNSYLELMHSEQDRPDFDLLHLKLLTKKDNHDSTIPMVSYSTTTVIPTTTTTTSSPVQKQQHHRPQTPTTPQRPTTPISKKPSPLIKKQSSPPSTTTTTTSPKTPTLTKTISSINLSPSSSSNSTTSTSSGSKTPVLTKTMSSVNLPTKSPLSSSTPPLVKSNSGGSTPLKTSSSSTVRPKMK